MDDYRRASYGSRTWRMRSLLRVPTDSTAVGKKAVMAVTGLLMLAFLLVHMLGNLKIFFGGEDFDHYAHWLRTIGARCCREPGSCGSSGSA